MFFNESKRNEKSKTKMVQKSDDSIDNSEHDLKASIDSVSTESEKNNR